jgi:hypothetical protein
MSNTLAVAAVTESLCQLLRNVQDHPSLAPTTVSALPPGKVIDPKERTLNVFLYQLKPNSGWGASDLPQRGSDGSMRQQPVLALDLQYVITSYGAAQDELDAQHLLGHAMTLIHEIGWLTRAQITDAVTRVGSPIAQSDLAAQIDGVKLTPQMLTEEDLYRLWTVFQSPYRLSVGYQASVVLLQRSRPSTLAPPVLDTAVTAITMRTPLITGVAPIPVVMPGSLTITGSRLTCPGQVTVRLPAGDVVPPAAQISDAAIVIDLPAGTRAGPATVQVLHDHLLDDGVSTRRVSGSIPFGFEVTPTFTPAAGLSVAQGGTFTLTLSPAVGAHQSVQAIVGDQAIDRVLDPAADPGSTSATAAFALPASLAPATYLLRVAVDGTQSQLTRDATGTYTAPTIDVTP